MKIYRISNRGRTAYQVASWHAGKRHLKNFARFSDALSHANEQATLLSAGQFGVARMNENDRDAFVAAAGILKPLGVPLLDAVKSYVAAAAALPAGASLLAAAQFYASRHSAQITRKLVSDVVTEFLAVKKADGSSEYYLQPLRSMLAPNEAGKKQRNSFAAAFPTYIDGVTTAHLDAWLRARDVGTRRRRNMTLTLRTVFNFASGMGYLPKNQPTEADGLQLPKKRAGKIGIFTPAELRTMLTGTEAHPLNDEAKLWFALGAFSGIRSAEMLRLQWGKHVQVEKRQIVIADDIAKVSGRRIIRMADNLAQWLAPFHGRTGKVFTDKADDRSHAYAARLGVQWPHNGLRHSFISYAVALNQNIAAVSLEAGNSPAIVKQNYMELVSEAEAKEWFAIMPDRPANVVPMSAKRA